jgi:hypothetical protein
VPAPATRQVGSGPRPCQQPPLARWPPRWRGQPGRLAPWQLVPPGAPARGRPARRPANRHGALQHWLQKPTLSEGPSGGARLAEPCLRLLKGRDRAGSGHTEKEPKQRYPQILTRSGPRPIGPAGRPLGPRSPQAPPRVAPLPTPMPPPPRAPEAPKGQPSQASSLWPEDQLPVQPARATALGGQADRSNSPESPQLPRPRGQVPPRPVPAPRTGTLMSRPQILMAPTHLEAGSTTPGLASDPV